MLRWPRLMVPLALGAFAVRAHAQEIVRLPASDAVLAARPVPLFTVGREEGREWETFGAVADVAFDSGENLYVLDRMNVRVVVFDSAGRFVRAWGRRGGGPGEFGAPQHMTVTPAGEVVVSDVGRRTMHVFGRDGSVRRGIGIGDGSLPIGRTLAPHPRGGVVSLAMGNPASHDRYAFGEEVVLWYPGGNSAPRPLLTVGSTRERQGRDGGGSFRAAADPVFSPALRFAVLPDGGLAVAESAAYAVKILDAGGRVTRVLRRPIAPRRVTDRDREAELARRERESAPGGLAIVGARSGAVTPSLRRTLAQQLREVQFAEVMPVIHGVAVDPAGNLWIQRSGPALDRPGPIDIVTPRGRYLGSLAGIPLPAAFSRGGRSAYVVEDEEGVQRVVVVRVPARLR